MTKTIKMSLVAAVAVAGLTTTSSATDLSESIKNTDLSGYVRYRYTNGKMKDENNEYKIVATVKTKVNDSVTAKIKIAGSGDTTNSTGDADPDTTAVKEANFIANLGGATVIAGKQALATPFADGGDQQGTGVVALYPVAGVTLAAGWYTNTDAKSAYNADLNLDANSDQNGSNDIAGNNIGAIAAIGAVGPVNYAVWYAAISESEINVEATNANTAVVIANTTTSDVNATGLIAGAKAINLNLAGKAGPVNVELNYASVDYTVKLISSDANSTAGLKASAFGTADLSTTQEQTRLMVSGAVEGINLAAAYITTGKDGGRVTLGDNDAQSNFVVENASVGDYADAKAIYLSVGTTVGPVAIKLEDISIKGHSGIQYSDTATTDAKEKEEETKLSVAYAMSKNFTISGFVTDGYTKAGAAVGAAATTKVETDFSRVEMKYTF